MEKIDWDSRGLALKIVKKYDEYKEWLEEERERILHFSPPPLDGVPGGENADTTFNRALALDRLEKSTRAEAVRAVDRAGEEAYKSIEGEEAREAIRRAVWKSCLNGRKYNFEYFAGTIPCERTAFYGYKNRFLLCVKKNMGF